LDGPIHEEATRDAHTRRTRGPGCAAGAAARPDRLAGGGQAAVADGRQDLRRPRGRESRHLDLVAGFGGPYPSSISVGGLKKGRIRDVNVRLIGLTHGNPQEVDVLLVGPGGQTAILMTHVGWVLSATDVALRLDDEATAALPTNAKLQSGHFRPTNAASGPVVFNAPAPAPGANASLSVFDGGNPNGTWRLFVQDRVGGLSSGSFEGGWELEITARVKAKKKR
jgi:hypothetical protein